MSINTIIINDNEITRVLLSTSLEKMENHNFLIRKHSDLVDAANNMRDQSPDLIFLSLRLPGINGYDITKLFTTLDCIIIFTLDFRNIDFNILTRQQVPFIETPIKDEELSELLNKVISPDFTSPLTVDYESLTREFNKIAIHES